MTAAAGKAMRGFSLLYEIPIAAALTRVNWKGGRGRVGGVTIDKGGLFLPLPTVALICFGMNTKAKSQSGH